MKNYECLPPFGRVIEGAMTDLIHDKINRRGNIEICRSLGAIFTRRKLNCIGSLNSKRKDIYFGYYQ